MSSSPASRREKSLGVEPLDEDFLKISVEEDEPKMLSTAASQPSLTQTGSRRRKESGENCFEWSEDKAPPAPTDREVGRWTRDLVRLSRSHKTLVNEVATTDLIDLATCHGAIIRSRSQPTSLQKPEKAYSSGAAAALGCGSDPWGLRDLGAEMQHSYKGLSALTSPSRGTSSRGPKSGPRSSCSGTTFSRRPAEQTKGSARLLALAELSASDVKISSHQLQRMAREANVSVLTGTRQPGPELNVFDW